jgi:hypothetical protein
MTESSSVITHYEGLSTRPEFIVTWLDFSNTFGSIPHEAILKGLGKIKAGNKSVNLIQNMYRDNTTKILTNTQPVSAGKIESGIKQGCPVSGVLFNITIDPIIRKTQGGGNEHKILAYSDHIVILAENPEEMQIKLNDIEHLAERISIKINPMKSLSVQLSGTTPIGQGIQSSKSRTKKSGT